LTEPAAPSFDAAARSRGRLVLVPNTLDFGFEPQDLSAVLPLAVIRRAAQLQHWIVEQAKTARSFLKRVHEVMPLATPLQALDIAELPRAQKGHNGRHDAARDGPSARPSGQPPLAELLAPALAGHDIGLLSEAGLPAVADPGAAVVAAAHRLGLGVVPLPGPSSLLLALAASGLDGQSFAFVGYLPQEAAARRERIHELEDTSRRAHQAQIFIETPYRNPALMAALLQSCAPATRLSVSVALTSPEGWSRTADIASWRRQPATLPNRLPAVFVLQG
jgi:16S rRNA (cytidine1402-2'-O)-methyltransferase